MPPHAAATDTVAGSGGARAIPRPMSRMRLFLVLAGLYLAQGIPSYLLMAALPPILRDADVSRTEIGLMALIFLPLVLKFLWAPWVDRWQPLPGGHRRGWILLTQSATILCMLGLLLVAPTQVEGVIGIGFLMALLIATQDIATDGYATRRLTPEDRGIGNAIQGGAVAAGVLLGGTLGLLLYHHAGWSVMLLTIAALSLLPLAAAWFMQEDDTPASPARPSLRAFLARPEARLILLIALVYRGSEGLVKPMEGAYLVDAGVPLSVIGYLSGASAATVGLGGSMLAAWMVRRHGLSWSLSMLGGLRTLCYLLFTLHALGLVLGVWPVFGAVGLQALIRYMEIVALYSLFMAVSASDQPGTDFTLLSCAQFFVYILGAALSGRIADSFGYPVLFGLAAAMSGAAVAVTVKLLRRV